MLMTIDSLAEVQENPAIETAKQTTLFLNYSATHPDAITENIKGVIILKINSDAKYISEPEARRRYRGYFFLVPKSNTPIQEMPPENGLVHVE